MSLVDDVVEGGDDHEDGDDGDEGDDGRNSDEELCFEHLLR